MPYKDKEKAKEYRRKNRAKIKQYLKKYRLEHKNKREKYYLEHKEELKQKRKLYRQTHKEEISIQKKKYCLEHKEERKIHDKKYCLEHKNKYKIYRKKYVLNHKEECKIYLKKYQQEHKNEINKYRRKRRKTDINCRIINNLRSRIAGAIRKNVKSVSTMKLLGCSIDFLKQHLQSQFQRGMTWKNHGFYGWHIDHIKPCARFDLSKPEEQRKCFNYKNLQPLWAIDNLTKSAKYNNLLSI